MWGAQTLRGLRQAEEAGHKIRRLMEADGVPFRLYFYMSPYRRSSQVRAPPAGLVSLSTLVLVCWWCLEPVAGHVPRTGSLLLFEWLPLHARHPAGIWNRRGDMQQGFG